MVLKPLAMIACGDRNWTDKDLICEVLIDYDPNIVIEGRARGADKLSGLVVDELNQSEELSDPHGMPKWIEHIEMPADWDTHHKAAGPIRNSAMLKRLLELRDEGYEVVVVAFHDDIENSKGTKDMVTKARKAGVIVEVVAHE